MTDPSDPRAAEVARLMSQWNDRRAAGDDPEPPDLTPDRDLWPLLAEEIAAVKLMQAVARASTNPDADAETDLDVRLVPAEVPGYEVLGELGEGGMGVVYKARQTALGRVVALKMMTQTGRTARLRFLAEAAAVAAVKHPNVVEVYEAGDADGRPFLALEYLPGGTLRDRLAAGGWVAPRPAAELVAKVARGVAAVHDAGVVHRDLKPANVLFDGDEPKVADFGLAKRETDDDLTRTGTQPGTPAYMAPEQARGDKFVGPPADVWALGVVLYECLTGQRPFAGRTAAELFDNIRSAGVAVPRGVPRDLAQVCRKCLEKDAANRYPTARELADDLGRFLAGKPVTARPVSALVRATKWVRRNPRPTAALAVLVAALAGMTYLYVRAVRAEAARQQELAESFVREAGLAVQRGKWADAEVALDRALAEGHADPNRVRLERANVYFNQNRGADALAELDAVEKAPRADGRAKLLRANILLGSNNPEAMRLAAEALALGLSPADAEYVRGMQAEDVGTANGHLRKVLELEPHHLRANQLLAWGLFVLGRKAEARVQIATARKFYPDDADLTFLEAIEAAASGRRADADGLLAKAPLDPAAQAIGQFLVFVFAKAHDTEPLMSGAFEAEILVEAAKLTPVFARAGGRVQLLVPPPVARMFAPLLALVQAQTPADMILALPRLFSSALVTKLAEGMAGIPEGMCLFVRALVARKKDLAEAQRLLQAAVVAPAVLDIRRVALFSLIDAEWNLAAGSGWCGRRLWKAAAVGHLHDLYGGGGLLRDGGLGSSIHLIDIAFQADEVELGRRMATDLLARAPAAWETRVMKALADRRAGAYGPALKLGEQLLAERPDDGLVRGHVAECRRLIRGQAATLPKDAP